MCTFKLCEVCRLVKNVLFWAIKLTFLFFAMHCCVWISLPFSCRSLRSGDRCGFWWTCSVPGFHWHGQKSQILQPVIEMEDLQERFEPGCDHFPTANMSVSHELCMCIHRYAFTVSYVIVVMSSSSTYSIPDFETSLLSVNALRQIFGKLGLIWALVLFKLWL